MNMDILSVFKLSHWTSRFVFVKEEHILNIFHLEQKTATILGCEVEKVKKGYCRHCFMTSATAAPRWTYDVFFSFMMSI